MTAPNHSLRSPRNNKNTYKADGPASSPVSMVSSDRRSVEEMLDMLCPICEEDCSCAGQTELRITKNKQKVKRPPPPSKTTSQPKKARLTGGHPRPPSKSIKAGTDASYPAGRKSSTKAPRREQGPPSISAQEAESIRRREDLDVQYALSEYYFSSGSEPDAAKGEEDDDDASALEYDNYLGSNLLEGDAEDLLADYYGYSSGSDIPLDSLLLQSSDEDDDTETDAGDFDDSPVGGASDRGEEESVEEGYGDGRDGEDSIKEAYSFPEADASGCSKTPEEALTEQLAKITPQILAAISVAAKTLSAQHQHLPLRRTSGVSIPRSMYYGGAEEASHFVDYHHPSVQSIPGKDTSIRLEEILDTKKLSVILSTSPPTGAGSALNYVEPQRRVVPLDAFRRSRRSSIQTAHMHAASNALRQNSINCTLAAAPDHTELLRRQRRAVSDAAPATPFGADALGEVTVEFEVHADDESASSTGATDVEWEYDFATSAGWWSTPALL